MPRNSLKFLIIVTLLLTSFILIPAVSAKEISYTVQPSVYKEPTVSTKLISTISQGATNTHYISVGSSVSSIEVFLNWYSSSDELSLSIYTPSSVKVGTYYDSADGVTDGKIHIDVSSSGNYVEQGTWTFKVYGKSIESSSRAYRLTVDEH